jgi:hypothetical protein
MSRQCFAPMDVLNGTWSKPTNNKYVPGTIATLTCDEGYDLIPKETKTIRCNNDFLWDFKGDYPKCQFKYDSDEEITEITDDEEITDDDEDNSMPPVNILDSPCRGATNLVSYYLTELNGISLFLKICLLIICLYKIKIMKKMKNKFILFILFIILLHTILHLLIFVSSLPMLCDSSNYDWNPGKYFNKNNCHLKYEIYNSTTFWLIGTISPLVLLILIFKIIK